MKTYFFKTISGNFFEIVCTEKTMKETGEFTGLYFMEKEGKK